LQQWFPGNSISLYEVGTPSLLRAVAALAIDRKKKSDRAPLNLHTATYLDLPRCGIGTLFRTSACSELADAPETAAQFGNSLLTFC